MRLLSGFLLAICVLQAQPKRVLFLTHSAGFRHDSIPVARAMLAQAGSRVNVEVTASEDVQMLRREVLAGFDAVFFYTSGELPISAQQKQDLLDFVRSGKGFGGAHSATDTLYSWPEYGELIGGYFDGHPWVQEARIDIEDPDHPATRDLPKPSFALTEEYYQFRAFSRERVRVLMTLDVTSVDLNKAGVNRTDRDFALAWVREFGQGRVFYTALGHFDETWRDARVQKMLEGALAWLTRQAEGSATPRPLPRGELAPRAIAPGAALELFGSNLTSGSVMVADSLRWADRLAGVSVRVNQQPAPLLYASPGQVNAQIPFTVPAGSTARVEVVSGTSLLASASMPVRAAEPAIRAALIDRGALVLYCTSLGDVDRRPAAGLPSASSPLSQTLARPRVTANRRELAVFFSGLAPGWVGLYQVNASLPPELGGGPLDVRLEIGDAMAQFGVIGATDGHSTQGQR
jgi:uncharacterized protein